jgi:hypothetical protein
VHNLALIEDKLKTLQRPAWPDGVLGKIDQEKAWRGGAVFQRYCSTCHAIIDPADPGRRIVTHIVGQNVIKTDGAMALNAAGYIGRSGILLNQSVTMGGFNFGLAQQAPVAALVSQVSAGMIHTPDSDKWWPQRFAEWLYDVVFSLRNNDIAPSGKVGEFVSDSQGEPLASTLSYKGRSLDGIWATAPYLHNGSVPTLYDLLLPAGPMPGDPAGTKYRPDQFMIGSREFDPIKVGFQSAGYPGFLFRTDKLADSNAGHEYGTRDSVDRGGNKLPALTEQERWDLIEYLKTL